MKNSRILFVLVAILMSIQGVAQIKVGVKGGLNFTDVNADLPIDAVNNVPSTNTSFLLGVTSEIPINGNLSFQPELHYAQRGFGINQGTSFDILGMNVPVGAKARTEINYLELPLLMKAKIGTGQINAYGIAGPVLSRATSAKLETSVTLLIDWNLPDVEIDLNDNMYNRNDIAAVVGGGVEFSTTRGSIFTDLRYQRSFNSILDGGITDLNIRNTSVQLNIGYSHKF